MKLIRLYGLIMAFLLSSLTALAEDSTRDRRFRVINAADGLADNSAQTIKSTFSGRLVVSTIGHINFYDGSGFTHISSGDSRYLLPKYKGHYHLYFDDSHHLWLKDKGMVTCVNMLTEKFVSDIGSIFQAQGVKGHVEDMFVDSSGSIWLVQGNNIYSRHGKVSLPLRKGRVLQDMDISDNIVLLFYDDCQVDVYDIIAKKKLYSTNSLNHEEVKDYQESSVIYKYRNGFFQIRNGNNKAVLMWFDLGTRQWTKVLSTDYYLSNMTVKDDVLYIASAYGYWTYDTDSRQIEHYEMIKLTDGRELLTDMNCIEFDRQGGMWIGTEKRGLLYSKYIKSPFNVMTWDNPLSVKYAEMMDKVCTYDMLVKGHRLNCTYKDSRGWIWVGSLNGLYYFKPGQKDSICVKKEDGMVNDVVHSIIEDGKHNIWVSTSNGIVGLVIKNGKVTFVNSFINSDGIPAEAFVNGRAMRLDDGTIVMQALDHVVSFNPMKMSIMEGNNILLHPKFVRLQVNGTNIFAGTEIDGRVVTEKAVSRLNMIELPSTQNSLSLKFSSLNYFRPIQTYYRYRVSGLQDKWVMLSYYNSKGLVDKNGILHLPLIGLKPGNYMVEVQASMYPGKWTTPPVKVVVKIKEPWWRTTGLTLLISGVFLILIIWNIVIFSGNSRLKMKRNVSEVELFRRIDGFISRAESCRMEKQTRRSVNDESEDVTSGADLDKDAVELLMELVPYSRNGKLDHNVLVQLAMKKRIKLTDIYDIITNNIFRSPALLTMAMLLEKASRDLIESGMTVEEIAEKNNFASPNYFIAMFFRRYGMTPLQWRSEGKGKVSSL
ncbi:MAG: helix-turn-helix domain-containing protein [Prevotellaceae bacterium]|nr:helix-turn-helix domain-containing protein [Prevotellaceae bacterium]